MYLLYTDLGQPSGCTRLNMLLFLIWYEPTLNFVKIMKPKHGNAVPITTILWGKSTGGLPHKDQGALLLTWIDFNPSMDH